MTAHYVMPRKNVELWSLWCTKEFARAFCLHLMWCKVILFHQGWRYTAIKDNTISCLNHIGKESSAWWMLDIQLGEWPLQPRPFWIHFEENLRPVDKREIAYTLSRLKTPAGCPLLTHTWGYHHMTRHKHVTPISSLYTIQTQVGLSLLTTVSVYIVAKTPFWKTFCIARPIFVLPRISIHRCFRLQ